MKLPINQEHHAVVRASLYYYRDMLAKQVANIPSYISTRESLVKELTTVNGLIDRIDRFYQKENQ